MKRQRCTQTLGEILNSTAALANEQKRFKKTNPGVNLLGIEPYQADSLTSLGREVHTTQVCKGVYWIEEPLRNGTYKFFKVVQAGQHPNVDLKKVVEQLHQRSQNVVPGNFFTIDEFNFEKLAVDDCVIVENGNPKQARRFRPAAPHEHCRCNVATLCKDEKNNTMLCEKCGVVLGPCTSQADEYHVELTKGLPEWSPSASGSTAPKQLKAVASKTNALAGDIQSLLCAYMDAPGKKEVDYVEHASKYAKRLTEEHVINDQLRVVIAKRAIALVASMKAHASLKDAHVANCFCSKLDAKKCAKFALYQATNEELQKPTVDASWRHAVSQAAAAFDDLLMGRSAHAQLMPVVAAWRTADDLRRCPGGPTSKTPSPMDAPQTSPLEIAQQQKSFAQALQCASKECVDVKFGAAHMDKAVEIICSTLKDSDSPVAKLLQSSNVPSDKAAICALKWAHQHLELPESPTLHSFNVGNTRSPVGKFWGKLRGIPLSTTRASTSYID